ncbi:MAG: hypothetical protein ACC652_02475 [Acidimicrobiales bacterium]
MTGILRRTVVLLVVCATALAVSASAASSIEWQPDSEVQDPQGELSGSGPNLSDSVGSQPAPSPELPAAPAEPSLSPVSPVASSSNSSSSQPFVRLAMWLGLIGAVGLVFRRFA